MLQYACSEPNSLEQLLDGCCSVDTVEEIRRDVPGPH
jgi:hypothetical protein